MHEHMHTRKHTYTDVDIQMFIFTCCVTLGKSFLREPQFFGFFIFCCSTVGMNDSFYGSFNPKTET